MKLNIEIKDQFLLRLEIIFIMVVMLFATSCDKSPVFDCFTSTGDIEKIQRELNYFHSIHLNDNINLVLNQSDKNKLVLEAGSNLMDKIITEVTGDSILIIRNDNTCNWVRSYDKPINVYLDFKRLENLEYRSIGHITNLDTLRLDSLSIDVREGAGKIELTLRTEKCWANLHYGTADIILRGISKLNSYYQLGAGKIDAREYRSRSVYMQNWGSNDMYIWATDFLDVEIKGLGNVYYKGNPEISSSLSGQGKLIQIEN